MTRRHTLPFVLVIGAMTTACLDADKDEDEDDTGGGDTGFETNAGWYADDDGDGWWTDQGDCDDTDPAVNPDAIEDCADGVDNDCDGLVDGADTGDCGEADPAGATGAAAPGGLDWSTLGWCAPEGRLEGLRGGRRAGSPFVVTPD